MLHILDSRGVRVRTLCLLPFHDRGLSWAPTGQRKLCLFCCEIDTVPRSVPPLIRCFGAQGPETAGLKFCRPADRFPSYCLQHCHRKRASTTSFCLQHQDSCLAQVQLAAEVAAVHIYWWDSGISSDQIHWLVNNSLFPLTL